MVAKSSESDSFNGKPQASACMDDQKVHSYNEAVANADACGLPLNKSTTHSEVSMTTAAADTTPPIQSQRPRWQRKRYWLLALTLLALIALSPNFGVWYRRHQMIQHLLGGYGQRYDAISCPFSLAGDAWPRKYLKSDQITPFDRVSSADLVLNQSSDLQWIADTGDLKTLVIFFPKPEGADDSGFAELARLTSLETLSIKGVALRGDGLKHIKSLPNLRDLRLSMREAAPGIAELSGHTTLWYLTVRAPQMGPDDPYESIQIPGIANDFVRAIRDLPQLRGVTITGDAEASAYESLGTNPSLTEVIIHGEVALGLTVVRHLSKIGHLKNLSVSQVEPGALAGLNGHHLQELDVYSMSSLPDLLRDVDTLPSLRKFGDKRPESDEEIALLAKCLPRLERLKLADTSDFPAWYKPGPHDEPVKETRGKITDEGLKPLLSMSHLSELDLGRNLITAASLETLGQMKQLKELNLNWTRITYQESRRLQELLPNTMIQPPFDPEGRPQIAPPQVQ